MALTEEEKIYNAKVSEIAGKITKVLKATSKKDDKIAAVADILAAEKEFIQAEIDTLDPDKTLRDIQDKITISGNASRRNSQEDVYSKAWDVYKALLAEPLNAADARNKDAEIEALKKELEALKEKVKDYDEKVLLNQILQGDLDSANDAVTEAQTNAANAKKAKDEAEQNVLALKKQLEAKEVKQDDKKEDKQESKIMGILKHPATMFSTGLLTGAALLGLIWAINSGNKQAEEPVLTNTDSTVVVDYNGRIAHESGIMNLNDFKFDDNNYIIINGQTIKTNAEFKAVFDDIKNPETKVIYQVESKYIDKKSMDIFAYEFTKLLMQHDTYLNVVIYDYAKANDVAMNDFEYDENGNMKIAQEIIATSAEGQRVVVEIAQDGAARVIVDGRYFKDTEAKVAFIAETMNLLVKERDAQKEAKEQAEEDKEQAEKDKQIAEEAKQEIENALNDALDELGEKGYTYNYVADENGNITVIAKGEEKQVNVVSQDKLGELISAENTTDNVAVKFLVIDAVIAKLNKELEDGKAEHAQDLQRIKELEEKIAVLTEKEKSDIVSNIVGDSDDENSTIVYPVADGDTNATPTNTLAEGGGNTPIIVEPVKQEENAENTDTTSENGGNANNVQSTGLDVPGKNAPILPTNDATPTAEDGDNSENNEEPTAFDL